MVTSSSRSAPVQSSERIQIVDVLRGFAILGILLFNMKSYSGQSFFVGDWGKALDRGIVILLDFLVQAKFYSLFSFLFGWGMAVQMQRAEQKGAKFLPVYLRRLLILFVFGALHSIFLWTGDILLMYAVIGLMMLLIFRKSSPGMLLLASVLLLASRVILTLPGDLMDSTREWCVSVGQCLAPESPLSESLYTTGTYWQVTRLRFQETLRGVWWFPCYTGNVFAMMLLGLYAGKRNLFARFEQHKDLFRLVMWTGLIVGVILNGIFVNFSTNPTLSDDARLAAISARTFGAPALMLFYITGITMLFQKPKWQQRLAPLAFVGRMALTNYISHSFLLSFLFYGYGLGLYGITNPTFGLILTLLLYRGQIQFSRWWFGYFRFGPLEWLWRTLTYNIRLPISLRKKIAAMAVPEEGSGRKRPYFLAAVLIIVIPAVILLIIRTIPISSEPGLNGSSQRATPEQDSGGAAPSDFLDLSEGPASGFTFPVHETGAEDKGAARDLYQLARSFSGKAALEQIEILSSDAARGRYPGTEGSLGAAEFIARKYAEYGLIPISDGEYVQSILLNNLVLDAVPSLEITAIDGRTRSNYQLHEDLVPLLGGYAGSGLGEGKVVWGVDCSPEDYHELDVVGKIVFCRSGNLEQQVRQTAKNGAAGLLLYTNQEAQPPEFRAPLLESWIPDPIPVFQIFDTPTADLLAGTGLSFSDLSIIYEPFEFPTRVKMEVNASSPCSDPPCSGGNLLGLLPGWDPAHAEQVIILSANLDGPGSTPDGKLWPGANWNASGAAALLEIARSWQADDYHPRQPVLFAIWDANRLDSLGLEHFLNTSVFPVENVIAIIHLNGIGSESHEIHILSNGLAGQVEHAAGELGLEFATSQEIPDMAAIFQNEAVPVVELTRTGAETQANLPTDTLDLIQVDHLEEAGQLAGLLALQFAELPPAVEELLAGRCQALVDDDLPAFLETVTAARKLGEISWFREIQSLDPLRCEATFDQLLSTADTARAEIQVNVDYQTEDEIASLVIRSSAGFQREMNGWRWAGPALVTERLVSPDGSSLIVHHPADSREDYSRIGPFVFAEYSRMAGLLKLSAALDGQILIYPDKQTLSFDTNPTQAFQPTDWLDRNLLKFSFNPIQDPIEFRSAIARLLLVNSGIPKGGFSWFWEGLPQLLEQEQDGILLQSDRLNQFHADLKNGEPGRTDLGPWAAVKYLQLTRGWEGIGRFISSLGEACQEYDCETDSGGRLALIESLGMDLEAFDSAWAAYWLGELDRVQIDLDAVLDQRAEAVLSNDLALFLDTVDRTIPHLFMEERHWFGDLETFPAASFKLTGKPISIMENGSLLARVTMLYGLEKIDETWARGNLPMDILFSRSEGKYHWAGPPRETTTAGLVTVRYPEGNQDLAEGLLENVRLVYLELSRAFRVTDPAPLTIHLYDNRYLYRSSVALSYPAPPWAPGWSSPGHSIKLLVDNSEDGGIDQHTLVWHTARYLLSQLGVENEWLLSGGSIYLAENTAGGILHQQAASSLLLLNSYILHEQEFNLAQYPRLDQLSENDYQVAVSQAWNAISFLADRYGEDALHELFRDSRQTSELDQALESVVGLSISGFQSAWKESFVRGHMLPGTLETSLAFDADQAKRYIDALSALQFTGRRAGSEGGSLAAAYIMEKFSEYGLVVSEQTFPFSFQALQDPPVFRLVVDGASLDYGFRDDFLVLQSADIPHSISGELVWISDQDYSGMDLSGKIAIRKPTLAIREEIDRARESGALALILVSGRNRPEDLLSRYPLLGSLSDSFPVLELSSGGFERLLSQTGHNAGTLARNQPAILLGGAATIRMAVSPNIETSTSNIIGLLPGSDPILAEEVVILGAHYDHVGDEFGVRYSGANDNASGVAVLLEIARLWQAAGYQPRRSVVFIAWGAQEYGEMGSNYYLSQPLFPLDKTVATLQLDAVGGGEGYFLEAFGSREKDGLLLFSVQRAGDLANTRLLLSTGDEFKIPSSDWLFSPGYLFNYDGMTITSDDLPFRQAGVPTLLLRWKDVSEKNPPDTLADEVLQERLLTAGITTTATLMILAR